MASAREIHVAPIERRDADRLIRRLHYSGTVVANSQLHFGVFLDEQLHGAMQFGPPMDKSKLIGLVAGTPWNGLIECNRMAFSEQLPRNSESRALAVALRTMRRHYSQLQWVISFADATCCGDGTIYRATGFALTGIRKNTTIMFLPNGTRTTELLLTAHWNSPQIAAVCRALGIEHKYRTVSEWVVLGARRALGYQLRYIFFLDPAARARLTVPEIPFAKIDEIGAGMYRGQPRGKQAIAGHHPASGGAAPTSALHSPREAAA